jgi:alkylhydroperoxidase/carboxymuconolactone decarboxylase family protein YurZ
VEPTTTEHGQDDFADLANVFQEPAIGTAIRNAVPSSYDAASDYWRSTFASRFHTPRMKELILLAVHASATALNYKAIERHVRRARLAGATPDDVLDVLLSIVGLANHAVYASIPILLDELKAAGSTEAEFAKLSPDLVAVKEDFLKTRGVWTDARDLLSRLMPKYSIALSKVSMEPWKNGSLTPKEREFIYIAIDCSVTHTFDPGLRLHIRNAIGLGAKRDEILAIFELAALLGLEGYLVGAQALFACDDGQSAAPL